MANSGSFRGWTSPSQQLFLPKVYWSSESVAGGWNVQVYVNADCYDVAINPLESWQTTISIAGQEFNPVTKGLFYDGKPRIEIRWIEPFSFFIPSSSGSSQTLDLHIHFKAFEQYAGVHLTDVYASQAIDLGVAIPEYTRCGAPATLYLSRSSNGQLTTKAKIGEKVVLSWTAGAPGTNNPVSGYKVQYSVGEGWVDLATLSTSVTTYTFKYASHKKNSFRIQTIGSVSGYDSDWSQTFSYDVENSSPTISNLRSSNSKIPYNNGLGSTVSFQWNSEDIDRDSLSYSYLVEYTKDGVSKSFSGSTSLKSVSLGINGDKGTSIKFSVRASDGSLTSSYISTNISVNTPPNVGTINSVIYPSGAERPTRVNYNWTKGSTVQSFEIYLEIGDLEKGTSNFKLETVKKLSTQNSNTFTLSLLNNSITSIIKELKYYRIKVRAYDGFDYSNYSYSSLNRKNIYPNYNSNLVNYFPDAEKISGTNYWKLNNGRIRVSSVVYNKVYLNFNFPSDSEIEKKQGLPVVKANIYRAEGDISNLANWYKIASVNKTNLAYYEDDISDLKGSHVNYKIVFEDEDGWIQQESSADEGILYLKVNTAPVFLNQFTEVSRFSTSGTPTIKVYEDGEFVIKWAKTTGDTDDEYVLMGEGIVSEGLPYLKSNGKFKISLEFYVDQSLSIESGYPKDLSGNDINTILITEDCSASSSDITYNSFAINFSPSVVDYFENFSNLSKRQKYSNVSIVISAYDTYDLESTNKIYIPIMLDFRQKPYFSQDNLSNIKDISNNHEIKPSENKETGTENAYTSQGAYMINSGEKIRFEIPKAYSPNSEGDDEISSYIIYYVESYSNIPGTGEINNILIEIPKEDLSLSSNDLYYYDYSINYQEVNSFRRFGVAARDSGYGRTEEERIQNSLISDIKIYNSIIMFCRCTKPSISLNDIDFTGTAVDAEISSFSLNFTLNDIGGSRDFSNSTYWQYRNFERFNNGRKFLLQLLYSEKENFPVSETGIADLIDLDSNKNTSFFYPPSKEQQESEYAYPWTFTIPSPDGSYLNPKKNYYVKLRLIVNSSEKQQFMAESLPVFLRSRRPTFAGRKNKIGINTSDPKCTFQVSAESDALNDNNFVIFDTGADRDILFRFNLLNAHMERGVIDCGEIF